MGNNNIRLNENNLLTKDFTAKFSTFERTNIKDMNTEKVYFIAGCPAWGCINSRKVFNWKHDYCKEPLLLDENGNIICQRCQLKEPIIGLKFKCDNHIDFKEVDKEKICEILSISSTNENTSKIFKKRLLMSVCEMLDDSD